MAFDYSSSFAGINNALGNIGKQNEIAYQRQTLANLGKQALGGDYNAAAGAAFAAGDAGVGLGLLKLGQTQKQEADWLKANGGVLGGAGGAAPSQSTGGLGQPKGYFGTTAGAESSNNPTAKNPNSSATGLYQFTDGTWADVAKANPQLGLTPDGRTDPEQQQKAMQAFTGQNAKILQAQGIPPNDANLYMTHFLGAKGGPAFLQGMQANPNAPAVSLVSPQAAAANRSVFYNQDGTPKTAGQVYTQMTARYGNGSTAIAQLQGGGQPEQAQPPVQSAEAIPGEDPAKLRTDAQYYAQSNPEAARQMRARADALEQTRGVQVAQAGVPASDAPAPGAANAQGFVVPGAASTAPNVASDPTVVRLQRALTGAPEKFKASIQSQLDVAIKDAERRYNEGKAPEAVREWQWARQNGMTTTKSPTAYAAELAAAKRDPDTDVTNLRKEVQQLPSYKNIAQAAPIYRSMFETAGRDSKASDLNLVYGLGKIMDPTSVVREGEMVMVKNSAGLSEQLLGAINSLNGGAGLTAETRQALMTEAYSRMNTYKGQFDQDMKQYRGIVGRRGFNADDVIPDPGEFSPYEGAPKAPGKGQPAPAASPAPVRPVESQYVRPDGSSPPTPSARAAPAGPRRGELIDGYRFKGGDAGKPENWVKVK